MNSIEQQDDVEVVDVDETDISIPAHYQISSYGADYPVDALIQRMKQNDIVVPTYHWDDQEGSPVRGFQREYMWPRAKADRFIESLLLGLPVPGIFLVKEDSGRLLVLDGHQRLHTLQCFYKGLIRGQEYRLSGVVDAFNEKSYEDLDIEDRRRLDNSIVHATILKQEEPSGSFGSIYNIFERLNTGGMNLQPQEIRVALYHGALVDVLHELNNVESWRALYGARSNRLKDMEMVLRFLAFVFYRNNYRAPMKDFLNRYMEHNRNLKYQDRALLVGLFSDTCDLLLEAIGQRALKPVRAVNAAVADSVMTGIAMRLLQEPITDSSGLRNAYESLISNKKFTIATTSGTSQPANVETRMKHAIDAFANLA